MAGHSLRSSARLATKASLEASSPISNATPSSLNFKTTKVTTAHKSMGTKSLRKKSVQGANMDGTSTASDRCPTPVKVTPQKRPASPLSEDANSDTNSELSVMSKTPDRDCQDMPPTPPETATEGKVMVQEKGNSASKRPRTTRSVKLEESMITNPVIEQTEASNLQENINTPFSNDAVVASTIVLRKSTRARKSIASSIAPEPNLVQEMSIDGESKPPKRSNRKGTNTSTAAAATRSRRVPKNGASGSPNSTQSNGIPQEDDAMMQEKSLSGVECDADQNNSAVKRRKIAPAATRKPRAKQIAVKKENLDDSSVLSDVVDEDFAPEKKPRAPRKKKEVVELSPEEAAEAKAAKNRASKLNKINKYPLGTSPFPDHPHPTRDEAKTVVDLLSSLHGKCERPPRPPLPDLLVSGCGEVPSVLDALIRTLLSASTTAANSNRAFQGLVKTFGTCKKRGSVDWVKVKKANVKEIFEAIKAGGLADTKSKRIKELLDKVWEEGLERRKKRLEDAKENKEGEEDHESVIRKTRSGKLLKQTFHGHEMTMTAVDRPTSPDADATATTTTTDIKPGEDEDDPNDLLSLDHLHALPDSEILQQLTSYNGIGLKTASCVMLFCMARESFAVDTHVFRIARFLNWVPPDKSNRETAFLHLDAKLPDEYKYALHQLFIKHGRSCRWCRAGGPLTYEDEVEAVKKKNDKRAKQVKEEAEEALEEAKGNAKLEEDAAEEGKKKKPNPKKKAAPRKKAVKKEDGSDGEDEVQDEYFLPPRCPIEHLVKRFHGASKGKGASWETEKPKVEGEVEA